VLYMAYLPTRNLACLRDVDVGAYGGRRNSSGLPRLCIKMGMIYAGYTESAIVQAASANRPAVWSYG